jgi:hypothetical protein
MSYEASSDEWTDHGRITYEAGGLYPDDYSGLIGPDGDIYLFRVGLGGSEPPVVWKIDGETLTAESSPEVANAGATAIIDPNGTMYVLETVGGDTPDWQPQRLWAYDPGADAWELLPAIPEDRVNSLLVADADSDVLVIGGSTVPVFTSPDTAESSPLNTSFRYRPDVNSWSGDAAAPLNARADHLENPAALGADDAIYVMTRNGIGSPRLQGLAAGATTWTAVPTPSSVPDPLALSHVFASSAGQLVLMGRPDVVVVANLDALPDGS